MSQKITAIILSNWIIKNFPDKPVKDLTPLKLQKLAFYCFSIALAKGYQDKFLEQLNFEPWEHGPVSREIYEKYKEFKSRAIDISVDNVEIDTDIDKLFRKVIYIYGSLSPWKIREQTHREKPYEEARKNQNKFISREELREYFKNKFFTNSKIMAPEFVFDLSSFYLDGIPVVGFSSFDELAKFSQQIFFPNL